MPDISSNVTLLGWEGPLLQRAAEHLAQSSGGPLDLGDALVAVPGSRAGRLFRAELSDALRRRGWSGFFPPRVLTPGRLLDELVPVDAPIADRLTRTLAWERALIEREPRELEALLPRPPARTDRGAWRHLAEQVRTLHAELCEEGHDFDGIAEILGGDPAVPPGELRRWRALAGVQRAWRDVLAEAGTVDPHEARLAAIAAERVTVDARVVLVGIVEPGGLLRRALERLERPVEALVFAPEEARDSFDELGGIRPSAWRDREIDLPLERWRVVETPDDQARMAIAVAAEWTAARQGGTLEHAGDLVIGVPDEEVTPYLERRLATAGVRARDAAGTPIEETAPARLLECVRAFLRTRSSDAAAELVRHTDLGRILGTAIGRDPVAAMDRYREAHLPRRFEPSNGTFDVPVAAGERHSIAPLLSSLEGVLGVLNSGDALALHEVAAGVRTLLSRVYADHPMLEGRSEEARTLDASLEALGAGLGAIERIPQTIAVRGTAADGIELVLRAAAAQGPVPPLPSPAGEPAVELLGWLELLLGGASHVVVTGFNQGRVPESPDGDSLLPDAVRTKLGLEDEERRFARDAYTLSALLGASASITLVSGRRTRDGDPIFPSRLAFQRPESEAVERLQHALNAETFAPVEREGRAASEVPPIVQPRPAPLEFSVTSFMDYIESPIMFHVRRSLRLRTMDDRAGQLDALAFGNIAHEALESFGRSPLSGSTSESAIFEFLEQQLERARQREFPRSVMATVPLQFRQLLTRFRSFASAQASRAAEGWRIEQVEWRPDGGGAEAGRVRLPMGESEDDAWLVGTIDRIDKNGAGESARWCVLDYKTGHKPRSLPKDVYRTKSEEWLDLQLPLYAYMVRELVGSERVPDLGYVNLPGDGSPAGFVIANEMEWWSDDLVESALGRAREIVREVRSGERLGDIGRTSFLEPIEEELVGVGLIVPPAGASSDESETPG